MAWGDVTFSHSQDDRVLLRVQSGQSPSDQSLIPPWHVTLLYIARHPRNERTILGEGTMYFVSLLETTTYCNMGTIRYGMYTRGVRKQRAKRGEARREERGGIYMTMVTQSDTNL